MSLATRIRRVPAAVIFSLLATSPVHAQAPAAAPTTATPVPLPAPIPPPSAAIRSKISAGDLLSAESILESYRNRVSEDAMWLVGYSWLARGALLLGETAKADRYAADVYARCAQKVAGGADLAQDGDLAYALGSAIEVEAQRAAARRGRMAAAEYLRGELSKWKGSIAFRSRLHKRLNMLTLEGQSAPELVAEDFVGNPPPTLGSLKGRPVVLYIWEKSCGDCRAQAPALVKACNAFSSRGVELVALTRFDEGTDRAAEKARADSSWQAEHTGIGAVPIVVSAASMERYGGSSTPTFVFLDRAGVVRRYTPTRLTEDELNRTVSGLLR